MGKCVTARQMILSEDRKVKCITHAFTWVMQQQYRVLQLGQICGNQSSESWKRPLWILITAIWTRSNNYSTEWGNLRIGCFLLGKEEKLKQLKTLLQNIFVFWSKQEDVSKNTVNEVRFVLPLNQRTVNILQQKCQFPSQGF